MIEINHLCKSFGTLEVLKDISLTVKTGEIYGLVGRSGAGKSTLLRCINGLENYDSGSLKIDGTEIRDLSKQEIRELRHAVESFKTREAVGEASNFLMGAREVGGLKVLTATLPQADAARYAFSAALRMTQS